MLWEISSRKSPKGSALGNGPKSSPTFPSIHVAGLLITALKLELLNFERMSIYFGQNDATWGCCLGGPCSGRALRGQDLHWSIRWLGQGTATREAGRKVSAVRGRSTGLLKVYTVEWAKLVYFPGEKHDFLENTWYLLLRFFHNHDFRYLFCCN